MYTKSCYACFVDDVMIKTALFQERFVDVCLTDVFLQVRADEKQNWYDILFFSLHFLK